MIRLWKLTGQGNEALVLPDMSSLDAITRQLPGGFYTTFRTYHDRTRVLGLSAHLDRLYRPLAGSGIIPSVDLWELRKRLATLLVVYPAVEARLRPVLAVADGSGMVFVVLERFQPLTDEIFRVGVDVVTTHAHRDHPELKSTSFISESDAERHQILERSAFEGLLVQNGRILEGLTSNFFYLVGGNMGTTARGVLNGVTRRLVIRIAREERIKVSYRSLRLTEIAAIDEAFLTSSSRGVVPIITIDGQQVGKGRVGQGVRRLMRLYEAEVEKNLELVYGVEPVSR